MPHLILEGGTDLERLARDIEPGIVRWGRAVLKTSGVWVRRDGAAVLVEGVVIEFSRPLLPVAIVALHRGDTAIRLWGPVSVERTRAVQRWLALVAVAARRAGGGPLKATNLSEDLWNDLELGPPEPRIPA
ncbi:MAG: hypothetical protein GXP48_11680 [Acidobacteria bacterium]|nr:hypothetical protein [Acidobacteriota bacterium]